MFLQKLNQVATVSLFVLIALAVSCRFYRPVPHTSGTTEESANFISTKTPGKYFILHKGAETYGLNNISVDKNNLTMSGKLSAVDPSHFLYINAKGRGYRYNDKNREVLNEIHIYVNNSASIDTVNPIVLPLSQVEKIEVIEHDRARTTTSYVLGGIGIGIGVAVLTGVIIALTKESCPFISVYDGEQFQLQAELFGGAVNRQLERMDYVPLNATPVNGEFQIRLSNELKERQYTDFADLLVVEHPANVQVLPNADGKLFQVSNPMMPVNARLNDKWDVLHSVSRADGIFCSFSDTTNTSGINELSISFKGDENAKQGKLILHLKNSYWLDYLYGEFTRYFGSRYESWKEKQRNKRAEEMIRWTEEQQIPLTVAIQTKSGWKEIQKLKTVGPLVNRNIIIPFQVDGEAGKSINIKLTTGFMFWDVDYAAVDFSDDQPLLVTRLKPAFAEDENGNSVLANLVDNDKNYLSQPNAGNYAILKYEFNQQPRPGNTFSVIFHTSGYYEPIREFAGRPDVAFLRKFKEPGYMPVFSVHRFQQLSKEQAALATNK